MALLVRPAPGELLSFADGLRQVYTEAFTAHPWQEDEAGADLYLARLARDIVRPGFTAALALDGDTVLGFATAWTTPDTFPSDRCYPQVSAALGPDRTADWLCGSREVDELAVAGRARGIGLGARLLDTVTIDRPDGQCWLLTSVHAEAAMRFYRGLGWTQATHPAPGGAGIAAFLGPRHPARTAATPAL
ncbi:GNAT family N-acetyltransferase [Streptomyces sp. NBC_01431]|uniref:GNAT family N-acetyltransferase n=1 Tax=Streptomyces sp. NBC_01431 TaxID=2903863 RepID=UPI002E362B1E|nr:GNAT family N-acetyltransferase [Streptomyces sp. NBC_01431]